MKCLQESSQFSLIASQTPTAPHNDITSPSKRSPSITTQPCRARTRGRCGCATIARPGGPSLGCAVLGYHYYSCSCCVFFAFVAIRIRALVFGCVCRHTPALVLPIMYVSRVFRYNRAQWRPSGRWQRRVKGCRTSARVKFCEGARTCVRTRWHYPKMHLEDCSNPRRMPSAPPFLGHNTPIYEEGALISAVTAVMRECCRKFPPRTFPEIDGGHFFIVMEQNVSNYIAGIIAVGPGRRYTLSIYSTTTPFLSRISIKNGGIITERGVACLFFTWFLKAEQ